MQDNDNNYNYGYGDGNYYNPKINYKPDKGNNGGFAKGVFTGIAFSIFVCLCVMLLSFFWRDDKLPMGGYSGETLDIGSSLFSEEDAEKLELIQTYIDLYSYYEQDAEAFKDNVFASLMYSLDDDYAAYYNKEAYASLMQGTTGEYSGIGCVVTQDRQTGQVIAVQPYKGSPAYEAGIAIGDVILKADDVELTGMDLNEAVTYIQGKEGTSVKITFLHDGEEKTVEVTRRKIEIPTIEHEMLENNIGYIKITDFDEVTVSQFEKALEELQTQGAKGFIFDVRSNPGGLYDSVVSMLDTLLPEGTIVYTEDKYGNKEVETSDADCIDLPMAVLINGDSASASEIFAGALQDYEAAKIIGTNSFGKGIVQSVVPLQDGSAIKFTVASYFTPNGVCIHGVGIKPDIEVELPEDENAYDENGYLKEGFDTQLEKAIEYINGKTE